MKRLVVVFVDDARRGSCLSECEGVSPDKSLFQAEARRQAVEAGMVTREEAERARFIVQD